MNTSAQQPTATVVARPKPTREEIAMHIMAALCSRPSAQVGDCLPSIAAIAVAQADLLIAELNPPKSTTKE